MIPDSYGTICPECNEGIIHVVNTKVSEEFRVRYLGCRHCGYRPEDNTWVVSTEQAPRRKMSRLNLGRKHREE